MSHLLPLSQEDIDNYSTEVERIASNVARNSLHCCALRVNIVGPRASIGEKKNGTYIAPGETKFIYPESKKSSFIFNGLQDVVVNITSSINNILIRDCHNVIFYINGLAVSGVSILKCSKVNLIITTQNTTTLEEANRISIQGIVTPDTVIYVQSSVDVHLNNKMLMVNPFTQGVFIQDKFYPTRYIHPELQTILP